MMGEILVSVLIMSAAGTALELLITLSAPLTRKIFNASWQYYIRVAVLVIMVLPISITLPQDKENPAAVRDMAAALQTDVSRSGAREYEAADTRENSLSNVDFFKSAAESNLDLPGYIWLAGAAVSISAYIIGYIRFVGRIKRSSVLTDCPEIARYTKRKVAVRIGDDISSPFMTGVLRPILVLPKRELDDVQLDNILRHETTHLKRGDILIKWFAAAVRSVHWFNPAVYYILKRINVECEISCDLAVVSRMDREEEAGYINTILSLLSCEKVKSFPLTTGMTGSKKILKRRFVMIKNKKKTGRIMSAVSVIAAAAAFSATVFASGVMSGATRDGIEITDGGSRADFENDPLYENQIMWEEIPEDYLKDPRDTVERFFAAFSEGSFARMRDFCTDSCIENYMVYPKNVFGMKRARLISTDIDFVEYAKSSNDFNVFVTVEMTPAEISAFPPNQTDASFYVCLIRQPDGRYLIDSFVSGL